MAGTVITTKGLQLIAKLVASGTVLTFTRASVGSGSIPAGYDPKNMTDLSSYKMDGSISSCSSSADEASIIMQISSVGVETGFTIMETGLFATDPDEGEILYAYLDLSKDPQYVYAEDSAISKFVEMTLIVKVGSVETVTAYLNPKSLVTRDGDISETVIETLNTVEDKYPIPAAGESVKRFFGKVLTFIKNIRPLTADITFYVSANAGSDITGDGSQSNPYASIEKALGTISKDLGGYTAAISISDGTYNEDVIVKGISNGYIRLQRNGVQELNDLCNVKSIRVENCNSVSISGLNLTTTDVPGIFGTRTDFINVQSCQSISNANTQPSFNFDYVSVVRVAGNRSLNHYSCLRSYFSEVSSEKWSSDSVGIQCGIDVSSGGKITKCDVYQPRGNVIDTYYAAGVIVSSFGAKIGSLSTNVNLYVATTGSDTTGDGTSAKPFKTIQHAIDILPNDFDTHSVMITVASGIYNEDIEFSGFTGGLLQLTLSGNVTIGSLLVRDSRIVCASTSTCTLTIKSLYVTESGRFDSFSNIGITTTGYVNDQPLNGNKASIAVNRGDVYISGPITLTGNTDRGISAISISRMYFSTVSGSGFSVGVVVSTGSVVTCGNSNGMAISATLPIQQSSGGTFTYASGTHISGDITAGLSCTWGSIKTGYARNGNISGIAQIILNMRIENISALTAGNTYYINGLPPTFTGRNSVAVSVDTPGNVQQCFLNSDGSLQFTPKVNVSAGAWNIAFSATYITSS